MKRPEAVYEAPPERIPREFNIIPENTGEAMAKTIEDRTGYGDASRSSVTSPHPGIVSGR